MAERGKSKSLDQKRYPEVAILGRPNVGKSTLFNRLVGGRRALVFDEPGVTRDYREGKVKLDDGRVFTLIDTGGLDPSGTVGPFAKAVTQLSMKILDRVDAVIFLVNREEGLLPLDEDIARELKARNLPVVLAVNKVDSFERAYEELSPFFKLGFDPVSVLHWQSLHKLWCDQAVSLHTHPRPKIDHNAQY